MSRRRRGLAFQNPKRSLPPSAARTDGVGFLKLLSDAAHPHSPSRVAVPHDAPRGPRGARPGAATGGRGASAGVGARTTGSTARDARRPIRRISSASACGRSACGRAVASERPSGERRVHAHPARRGARHRAHTRGGVCLARCRRPERTEPRRVDRPASPRSARETERRNRRTDATDSETDSMHETRGVAGVRSLPPEVARRAKETSEKACGIRRVTRA